MAGLVAKCSRWTDAAGIRLREPRQEAAVQGEGAMRYLYIGLIVVFTALVLLFKFQNLETATVSLFSASITLPISVLVFGVYVLGMLTGGCLYALFKSWVRGARQRT
jgi:uncharacterized integral membrane protein